MHLRNFANSRDLCINIFAILVVFIFALSIGNYASAAKIHPSKIYPLQVEVVTTGLKHPWAVAMLPEGNLLVSERAGRLLLLDEARKKHEVSGLPKIASGGQGGLLDVVVDPQFATNSTIYFSYAKGSDSAKGTAIASARFVQGDTPHLEDVRELFVMKKLGPSAHHFGSRIVVARDGTLFFSIGDRGEADRAQDSFDHAGSILRINKDGTIPADNPFVKGKDGAKEIWSTGHRNPQGATIDPATGKIWTVEHGARGGDEINQPQAGKNYGWPTISYGRHYSGGKIGLGNSADGLEQPVHYWDPSIAPSGLAFYDGELFPRWKGNLFVGALKHAKLVRLEMAGGKVVGEEHLLERAYGRIRDVRSFSDGALWVLTDAPNGKLLRITPAQ